MATAECWECTGGRQRNSVVTTAQKETHLLQWYGGESRGSGLRISSMGSGVREDWNLYSRNCCAKFRTLRGRSGTPRTGLGTQIDVLGNFGFPDSVTLLYQENCRSLCSEKMYWTLLGKITNAIDFYRALHAIQADSHSLLSAHNYSPI